MIADNASTGIIYLNQTGTGNFLPNVYKDIAAFNNATGVASLVQTSSSFAFMPVSFSLANEDVFGNTLENINFGFFTFRNRWRARWLVMLPRTSAAGTPALQQSAGIKTLLRYALPMTVSRKRKRKSTSSPVFESGSLMPCGRTLS